MRKGFLISSVFYVLSLLPMWLLYLMADLLYYLLYYIIGYRKSVVRRNLANAFPEKTERERKQIENAFFRYLPELMVEVLKLSSISAKEIQARFKIRNPEELQRHIDAGKSAVLVTSHYGNWEMAIHAFGQQFDFPALIIYKPLRHEPSDRVFKDIRERFGAIMVPMKQTFRYLIQYAGTPTASVFVADQSPTRAESDFHLPFLNQETYVFTGPEKVAKRMQSPVVFCRVQRVKRGYYVADLETIVEDPRDYRPFEITKIFTKSVEDVIREKPEWWLWSHKRWKRTITP